MEGEDTLEISLFGDAEEGTLSGDSGILAGGASAFWAAMNFGTFLSALAGDGYGFESVVVVGCGG
jgi:hypothetical protein